VFSKHRLQLAHMTVGCSLRSYGRNFTVVNSLE